MPKLSICIPTYNRAQFLDDMLESLYNQGDDFEIVICDNASPDNTGSIVTFHANRGLPIRYVLNHTNIGFDLNYKKCLEEARSPRVWIMGDDDAVMPGGVARVLESNAEVMLLAPIECDINLSPLALRNWFEGIPAFRLDTGKHLDTYMKISAYHACMGAFISAMVLPRDRVLAHMEQDQTATDGYLHLWGIIPTLIEGVILSWDPMPIFLNRLGNDKGARETPFLRFANDALNWNAASHDFFLDNPNRDLFNNIHRRNFKGKLPEWLKAHAPTEEAWETIKAVLLDLGYPKDHIGESASQRDFRVSLEEQTQKTSQAIESYKRAISCQR